MLKLFVILLSVFAFSNITLATSDVKDPAAKVEAGMKAVEGNSNEAPKKEDEKEATTKAGDMLKKTIAPTEKDAETTNKP